jgi:D-alanyl-lipoteichoic acid acyltransferase DltB (MBOAT superfamily)
VLFNSLTFAVFFLVVWSIYRLLPGWGAKKNLLLVASYLFYGAWHPPFALLLLTSTVVDWYVAGRMDREERPGPRKAWLALSLCVNLGMLGFFKYGDFLLDNVRALFAAAGVSYVPPHLGLLLPIGISFYTFETLSYTIDVYRREIKAEKSLRDFVMFVSFFPHLVAGPIVRARDFLCQLTAPPLPELGRLGWGLFLITLGLFQKVVLADTLLAPAAQTVFGHPFPLHAVDAWFGVIAFAFQILFDFGGYSLCAIGTSLCFGFHIMDNFKFPYASVGFSDFWRRWHISLSSWLRDYFYIPLGGNRGGALRTGANLMVVMMVGGLWHGAAWTFVVWGALHGLLLLAERGVKKVVGTAAWAATAPARFVGWALTFVGVLITWVFFRAADFPTAMKTLVSMAGVFGAEGDQVLSTRDLLQVGCVAVTVLVIHRLLRDTTLESAVARWPAWLLTAAWAVMAACVLLAQGNGSAFIYFQF